VAYEATGRALDAYTDHTRFEQLVTILLARAGLDVRPLGGSGDRGRDAVAGLYRAKSGEKLAVTISLNVRWQAKIKSDLARIAKHGLSPDDVIAVTNRATTADAQRKSQEEAASKHGVNLTINDRRWLITRLHLRENLDLRSEYLNLAPSRPSFFLDLFEYEGLLDRRGLLDSQFLGRAEDLDELERLLEHEGKAVIVEADGGFGKTRLAYELAKSGRSATPWFFVDAGPAFDLAHLPELEAGYPATVVIDDAHRRADLEQLLAALERRTPAPRLVFTVRPGHASAVATVVSRLALPKPETFRLGPVARSELVQVLQKPPFGLQQEAMLAWIVQSSEGNVGVALIAGALAARDVDPSDLSNSQLFTEHVEWRLKGAGLDTREDRAALALVAALGQIDIDNAVEAAGASRVLEDQSVRRRLNALADAGLTVEGDHGTFTIKPDIVREHLLRVNFFPEQGRPVLRYESVLRQFSPHRLRSLLQMLGEARVDLAPAAGTALAAVRREVIVRESQAQTPAEMAHVARLAAALGAGGAQIAVEVGERLMQRLPSLKADDLDDVAVAVVAALGAAKFGRDQLPPAWRLLLKLATLAIERGAPSARKAALDELGGIYSAVPVNYSSADPYVLAYVQHAIANETQDWWAEADSSPAASVVAARLAKVTFTLQLERHRVSAANAMAINMVAGYLPPSDQTDAMLRLGSRLFCDTFLSLDDRAQVEQLETLHALEHVSAGYPGLFGTRPSKELRRLAAAHVVLVEECLIKTIGAVSLPVAAEVLNHFRSRTRRPRGIRKIRAPRPSGDLRVYLDLVDNHPPRARRLDWQAEIEETKQRGRRHGRELAKTADPVARLEQWSSWIDACESTTKRPAEHNAINAALAAVAEVDPPLARALAEHAVEKQLAIGRFTDSLLDALVEHRENWPLVERWARDPVASVRTAAVRAAYRAPDALARPILSALARDQDEHVRSMTWQALVYGPPEGPSGWRLDVALEITATSSDPATLLDQLLSAARYRRSDGPRRRLTATQRAAITRIALGTASTDELPRQHGIALLLDELDRHGIDVVIPWLRARLEHVRKRASKTYIHPLPDELGPLVQARRNRAAARAELARLLGEVEKPATTGMYRIGVEEAINWLGGESEMLTAKVGEWVRGNARQRELACTFANSGNWRTFTKRARLMLDARPNDEDMRRFLLANTYPRSWIGSREPYFRSRAAQYSAWTRSKDPRLRLLGVQAVEYYTQEAEQAALAEKRERDRI
jgi:hypothetical protein